MLLFKTNIFIWDIPRNVQKASVSFLWDYVQNEAENEKNRSYRYSINRTGPRHGHK